ncbi:DinB family protein [Alkalicoccobacillus murimartini]|uniref:Damage-inducible protein DinB n=1 Tax=Alkalicoccobacillus murimartini TaxID=171685 RepID=A0ABT9YLU1_9BACI|nr:DinB family protein [Alkalicoccobacillus murimartini]MDQ0208851.1 putative damage-inducible protein DinB [Alkalicoccobacillus murimartini]
MKKFFTYNWQVRDEWFQWCQQLTHSQLVKEMDGGAGSILYTLFHIVEVENSWIRGIQGKEDSMYSFEDYATLEQVVSLSNRLREDHKRFIDIELPDLKEKIIKVTWDTIAYTCDDIIHHIIIHEIHHIGQFSIWARQLDFSPVPAHFVGRDLSF